MTFQKRYKVAVVGCGGVSEFLHLPALTKLPSVCVNTLVDTNKKRAREVAEKFCIEGVSTNYEEVYKDTDIALIALPNHLHAKATIDFLNHDVHVLCEKPMATTVSDCRRMIEAGKKTNAKLMIGHNRRFMSNVRLVKKMLENDNLGKVYEYSCIAGAKFRWPTQTGFYFKKEEAGGGVLIDLGVHFIDQLLWFFGDVDSLQYRARDVMGKGVEDNVSISFVHKNSVKGEFTLSRTEYLENKLLIKGSHGWMKTDVFDTVFFELGSKKSKVSKEFDKVHVNTKKNDSYRDQLEHFVDCINTDSTPLISGEEGIKAIGVIEKCYRQVPM